MAGLLDFLNGMDKKTQMGLLMAGANMMQTQRGDSPFAAVGNGLLGYAQGLLEQEKQAKDDARQSKQDDRQTRLDDVDMQMKQAQIQHYQNAPVGGDPYWTTIDTPRGLMKFNARTGEALPVQMEGKPLMKSSSDVALQSALEAGKTGAKTQNSVVEIDNPDGSKSKMLGGSAFPNLPQGNYIPPRPTDLSGLPQNDSRAMADSLLKGLIQTESSGNPNAVSPKGAIGLTQIMPETGRNPGYGVQPLQNDSPDENMRFGRDYLAALIKENGGDAQKALSAYNQGQGNLQKNGINNQGYVDSVLKNSVDLQNPLTKPTIAGMQIAAKNGVSPQTAIDEGVKIAEKSVADLKAVQAAGQEMYTGQTQAQKLAAETEAKKTQDQNKANIELSQKQAETTQKKSNSANQVIGLLEQATPLIETATNSGAGAMADDAMAFFGKSTKGADSAQALKALGANLIMQMPRMEGPQSDRDVQLYKEMAGQIADPWIPKARKMAALQTIKGIQGRYIEQSAPQQQIAPTASNSGWSIKVVE